MKVTVVKGTLHQLMFEKKGLDDIKLCETLVTTAFALSTLQCPLVS